MLSLLTKLRPLIGTSLIRNCSNSSEILTTRIDPETGFSIVTLNKPPVNSLNSALLKALSNTFDDLEDEKCRGMIMTSSLANVFCAGLDIRVLYKPDEDKLRELWKDLQDLFGKFFGSSFPTAVAMNGHAIAGGCLLATCAEYRVMCSNYKIGLNETHLGIVIPQFLVDSTRNIISPRQAEMAMTAGLLFSSEEALKIGLIDELAKNKEDAIAKCANFLSNYTKISPVARNLTKQAFRRKIIQDFDETRDKDLARFVSFTMLPENQKIIGDYLESLKAKKMKNR